MKVEGDTVTEIGGKSMMLDIGTGVWEGIFGVESRF
jgi:hypothetical protein